ncbi:hypothetical protein CUT44_13775 [Streptomyces carminius]|uniref:Uncharacterized protein n=1 Tax=Streptomyces carminius TaxID=2665496 RepID=A0A2M8LYZ8_9ACTN|nr:hypothetical protein CUT44_13775 [Streptomyces carminius]
MADHASRAVLPEHLRTCQCREDGCRRHPRHRGCDGPLLLLLTRAPHGRAWHLADTCHACAATTPHSAAVPEDRQLPLPQANSLASSAAGDEDGDAVEHCPWWSDDPHFLFY